MKAKLSLIASMIIFGSIGIFVRFVNLPSSVIACVRGVIGGCILLGVLLLQKKKTDKEVLKKNLLMLVLSGIGIGFNWILLFESYKYTSIATATLCYYMAPVLIILASPFVLHEKLKGKSIGCVIVALIGMVCVSGVLKGQLPAAGEGKGIVMGLGAALLYAIVILMNKKIVGLDALSKTSLQLLVAGLCVIPYVFLGNNMPSSAPDMRTIILLAVICIIHTGLAYLLYFGSLQYLEAKSAAILSYIDPVVAIILSMVIFAEIPDIWTGLGAVLIIGASIVSET